MGDVTSLFVIGDVHGCDVELKTLLNKLPLTPSSTVVFLGDYIDRGAHSRQVVDTILTLRRFCTVITLTGNHEAMFADFLADPSSRGAGSFIYNGGGATLASYADEQGNYRIPEEHLRFFSELRLSYQTRDYFFVHAGVPDVPLAELDEEEHRKEMLWVRKSFHKSEFPWEKVIVHGHSPVPEAHVSPRRINIDTGCVYDHKLSAIELPSRRLYSVTRRQETHRTHLRDFSSNRIAVRYKGAVPVYIQDGSLTVEFETIDYSEFGLLMRAISDHGGDVLEVGQVVTGHIGEAGPHLVPFRGTVVRLQDVDGDRGYAIKIEALGAPAE